jgi:hypothetical protein
VRTSAARAVDATLHAELLHGEEQMLGSDNAYGNITLKAPSGSGPHPADQRQGHAPCHAERQAKASQPPKSTVRPKVEFPLPHLQSACAPRDGALPRSGRKKPGSSCTSS